MSSRTLLLLVALLIGGPGVPQAPHARLDIQTYATAGEVIAGSNLQVVVDSRPYVGQSLPTSTSFQIRLSHGLEVIKATTDNGLCLVSSPLKNFVMCAANFNITPWSISVITLRVDQGFEKCHTRGRVEVKAETGEIRDVVFGIAGGGYCSYFPSFY